VALRNWWVISVLKLNKVKKISQKIRKINVLSALHLAFTILGIIKKRVYSAKIKKIS
jgi:hypothetical protein